MNRSIIYVWSSGLWIYGVDYHHETHSALGEYKEVIIGEGWQKQEITLMVNDFIEESLWMWED